MGDDARMRRARHTSGVLSGSVGLATATPLDRHPPCARRGRSTLHPADLLAERPRAPGSSSPWGARLGEGYKAISLIMRFDVGGLGDVLGGRSGGWRLTEAD